MLEALAAAAGTTTHRCTTSKPHWAERTVSRYLPDRRRAPSQSWRTFLANEFGQLAFAPTVTSSDATGVHDVADARVCRFSR
jgi:hypothetical protein